MSAGCAFSVSVSVSAGPSKMMALELAAQRSIDFIEHMLRRREIRRQCLAHPDGLAALPRKHESNRHVLSVNCSPFAEIGPKDTSIPLLSSFAADGNRRDNTRIRYRFTSIFQRPRP